MADTTDPRFGGPQWAGESSAWPGVAGWNVILANIYAKAAIGTTDVIANQGGSTIPNQFFWAKDQKRMYTSGDGTTGWTEVSPIGDGSGGQGPANYPFNATVGQPGVARAAARTDHTHGSPPWPVRAYDILRQSPRPEFDSFPVSLGFVGMLPTGASVPNPRGGLWRWDSSAVLSAAATGTPTAVTAGRMRMLINGVSMGEVRCDMTNQARSHTMFGVIQANVGDLSINLQVATFTTDAYIYLSGTHALLTYLGPAQ